jgi:Golgi phosphoprotein 3 (GPP34)
MSPGLDGTGRVGDDLYLLAHNDVTGKPYIQPRPLGLGLAGGLLAELVLDGAISLANDQITVADDCRPPGEELAGHVLGLVAGEREAHPVRDWLAYLARTAPTEVARRLAAAGYLAQARRLLPWRSGRWVPVDRDSAFAPVLRARAALDPARPLTAQGVVLAGLAESCGLGFRLAQYAPAHGARPVHQMAVQLGPSLGDLIAQTKAAVDSAVLTHRV